MNGFCGSDVIEPCDKAKSGRKDVTSRVPDGVCAKLVLSDSTGVNLSASLI